MRLFSYKMTHDSGFAPNPFGRTLTLATCKPQIRLHKSVDDWIAGFTSRTLAGHGIPVSRIGCQRCWLNRPLSAGDTLIVQKIVTPTIAPVARAVTSKCVREVTGNYATRNCIGVDYVELVEAAHAREGGLAAPVRTGNDDERRHDRRSGPGQPDSWSGSLSTRSPSLVRAI